ncbi:MAG: hypothetical protein QXN87_05285 [Candidatus Bathyarchaeia archaeon]
MSEEAEEIKRLLAFKKKLEKRVEKLESEIKELHGVLETVNSIILAKGFKRAEITKPLPPLGEPQAIEALTKPLQAPPEFRETIQFKASSGELLAKVYLGDNILKVVLAEDKAFNINTPPFTQFLVERVLTKMLEKDRELLKSGRLKPEDVFSYNIVRDGDLIREIIVENFDSDRLRELKSSIRWTLEKMYEKMRG